MTDRQLIEEALEALEDVRTRAGFARIFLDPDDDIARTDEALADIIRTVNTTLTKLTAAMEKNDE